MQPSSKKLSRGTLFGFKFFFFKKQNLTFFSARPGPGGNPLIIWPKRVCGAKRTGYGLQGLES